ncbi:MAG: ribulose-phosphate 3-epimerase [Thermodesulfovibrionales bacterium]|nr:ribulose-phosphate 3-epimerase [Thermodesulfovibrionales bacterium]
MIKIAPSILSADFSRLSDEIKLAEKAGADLLHIDIMDGHFVPNITIGPVVVESIKKVTTLPLDVHLMISNPDRFLLDFIHAGANYLTVHVEASIHLHRTIDFIKKNNIFAGVSLNPATPIWHLDNILNDLDMVLIMSVNPGFGGQTFIPSMLDKIKTLKKTIIEKNINILIEVDGGIKINNAKLVQEAGADILVLGSAFFESKDYSRFIYELKKTLEQGN